jgi:hypothetical protein
MIDEDIHDDAGARRMLDILTDAQADPERRGQAAIKLGPGLQLCDEHIDWDDLDLYFGKATFEKIDQTFRRLYHSPKASHARLFEPPERALEKLTRHSDSDIADTAEWALGEFRMFSNLPDDLAGFDDDLF